MELHGLPSTTHYMIRLKSQLEREWSTFDDRQLAIR